MPAPLARGLILSLSLLIAAGVAVYENPQVREWIEANRRKLAQALAGGAALPAGRSPRAAASDDVSTREDSSAEAAERRRLVRQDILERARLAREWAASRQQPRPRGASFDDMVDPHGNLKGAAAAASSGADAGSAAAGASLRRRGEPAAFATAADVQRFNSGLDEAVAFELATRASTMSLSEASWAACPDAASYGSDGSTPPALTPTTSQAPSSWHPGAYAAGSAVTPPVVTPDVLSFAGTPPAGTPPTPGTPRSPAPTMDPATLESAFQSIHDWARLSTAAAAAEPFYSPPASLVSRDDGDDTSEPADLLSDFASSVGGVTPAWTEVGSVVSEEEHR